MELTERFSDLTKIHYLNSLTFSAFKQYCKSSCKNDAERKIQFDMMKRFCETNIKTRGNPPGVCTSAPERGNALGA